MTLQEYIDKTIGIKVRDGQCVALVRDYLLEVYSIPHTGSVSGAIDIWDTRYSNPLILENFMIAEGRPKAGDIIFFAPTNTNKYGHVAIVYEDKGDGFNVYEADGFNPDRGTKIAFWSWTRYVGALRPRRKE